MGPFWTFGGIVTGSWNDGADDQTDKTEALKHIQCLHMNILYVFSDSGANLLFDDVCVFIFGETGGVAQVDCESEAEEVYKFRSWINSTNCYLLL